MRLKTTKDGIEGAYEPSYFFMRLETNETLDKNLDRHSQTFIHEYIHFIQDIFLPYCVRNNVNEIFRFTYIADRAKKEPITRPFDEWNAELLCIDQQYEYTWGAITQIKNAKNIIDYEIETHTIEQTKARVFKYTAILAKDKKYQIGARDMLEYIAHKIESKHWSTDQPDFPYRTMDIIFCTLGLGDIPDMCKIALTEFCLHNDNPIHHLFQIIKLIRAGELGLQGVEQCFYHFDFLNYVLQRLQWASQGGFKETIHTKVKRRLGDLQNYLNKKYPAGQFRDISDWIEEVITYISINLKGKLYFSELYEKNKEEFLVEVDTLIDTLGIPLIFNSLDEHISLLPEKFTKDNFVQFYVSYKFNEFLNNTNKTCPICSFCESSNPSIMSSDCIEDVIRRVAEDNQCPFGSFISNHEISIVR